MRVSESVFWKKMRTKRTMLTKSVESPLPGVKKLFGLRNLDAD